MTVKLLIKNFPRGVKITDVKTFFSGIKIDFIKLNNHGKGHIEVKNNEIAAKALKYNKNKYKTHEIHVKILISGKETENESGIHDTKKFPVIDNKILIKKIKDTGRLYLRNLNFDVTEADITELFKDFGELVEVSLPYDEVLKRSKAFGFVTFMLPSDAVKAFKALDKTNFKGRKIHILPGQERPEDHPSKVQPDIIDKEGTSSFKKNKKEEMKNSASSGHNWNALFVNSDVVAQYLADKLNISKNDLFNNDALKGSVSVKLAQAETQLVGLIQNFLLENHIRLDILEKITNRGPKTKDNLNLSFALSSTTFIVKNLVPGVSKKDLEGVFIQYPGLKDILLPPYGITAIVTYKLSQQAKVAYQNCAYMEFKDFVMMLQWAPLDLFSADLQNSSDLPDLKKEVEVKYDIKEKSENQMDVEDPKLDSVNQTEKYLITDDKIKRSTRIIVKNISFQSTLKELEELFKPFPGITALRLPKKQSGGHRGFAFIDFETENQAQCLMDSMSLSTHLLGRRLVFLYSNNTESTE